MDTGRLGWAKAARSQVVLVKNADSQACPRPILSLDMGPTKWGGPISRSNQTALTHRLLTRANSLHYTCMQTTDKFRSLSANFKHRMHHSWPVWVRAHHISCPGVRIHITTTGFFMSAHVLSRFLSDFITHYPKENKFTRLTLKKGQSSRPF